MVALKLLERLTGKAPTLPTLDREVLAQPVEAAQRKHTDAVSARTAEGLKVKEAEALLAETEALFDEDPSPTNERAVAKAKGELERRTLLFERADRLVRKAADVVADAQSRVRTALLAHLDDRADGVGQRVADVFDAEILPLLPQLAAALRSADEILSNAHAAAVERAQLQGVDHHPSTAGIAAQRSVLRARYAATVSYDDRYRIEEFTK